MTNTEIENELEFIADEQPLSEEDQELLNTIYDRLDIFEQMNRPYHDAAKICRRIVHMDDPEQDSPQTLEQNKGRKTLQLQTLKSTINNVVADQMLNMPEIKLLPENPGMQDAADDLQDIMHHVMYCANNFEQLHYRRCEDFYVTGTAITQVAWDPDMDYGRGNIAYIRWPIEAFLWDPVAERLQDCRAVMKVSWHPLSWYREHYPKEGKYVSCDSKGIHNNVGMTEGQENTSHSNDEEQALLIEYWWREYNAETHRYKVNVAYAAGNALLEKSLDVYDHGMFPFVIDVHDSIEGALPGKGLVDELAPMMRYINHYMAYIDMNLRMSSKGRLLVQRSSGIDKEALTDWEQDVIEGDRIDPTALQWMQNQPFNSTIVQMMTMLESDLKADSGANQFTRGETTGGIVSGKAINSLIQAGGKISSMRAEQLKYGDKQMGEQSLWLGAQFFDEERVRRIIGRKFNNGGIDVKKLFGITGKGVINPPPYTVQIEVSSRDPQRIANQNQMFMEAYTMSAQAQQFFPLSALFRILNLDGKDKILPVIEENETYQQQMQQMQQQLEQMGQQLEQLQAERDNLSRSNTELTNRMGAISNRMGGGAAAAPEDAASGAIVGASRSRIGQPTGNELPT